MNLDRNFWKSHFMKNSGRGKKRLVNGELLGGGGNSVKLVSPIQGEISKIEDKVKVKGRKQSKKEPIKKIKTRVNKNKSHYKKNQRRVNKGKKKKK